MADPTRARMLACLLGGEARTAGELARGRRHAAGGHFERGGKAATSTSHWPTPTWRMCSYVRKGWLQANQDSRALRTTAAGERNLLPIVGP